MPAVADPFAALDQMAKRIEQEAKAEKLVDAARVSIVRDADPKRCFFKIVTLQLDTQADWDVETAVVDGRTIRYNPEFISSLSFPETVGVLCGHEPLHCCFGHHARRGDRDPENWNIACDLAVNQVCQEAGFILPSCALMPGKAEYASYPEDLSAEEYYDLLPAKQGGGEGEGNDPGGCGAVEDAADDEAGQEQAAQQWERTTAQAAELAESKSKGSLPGALAKLVEEIAHPKVAWTEVLKDFTNRVFENRDDYNWAWPNRRYLSQGMYLPSLRSQGIGHVLVHVDCSGSTDQYMDKFASELSGVLEARPSKVTILYGDTQLHGKPVEWEPSQGPLKMERRGGGGTDHTHLAEYIHDQDEEIACVVALTDGFTTWPKDYGIPTLWVIVPDGCKEAPFGQVVEIN